MPEVQTYTLKDMEVKKDMPGYSGGPAKVLELTLEDESGTHTAEMFTMASTPLPSIGDKMEGTIEPSDYGPKWKKAGSRSRNSGKDAYWDRKEKRDIEAQPRIERQHSQAMALEREANIIAAGGRPYNGEQLRSVINWFDKDIKGKDRSIEWDGLTSDVPGDTTDLDPDPTVPLDPKAA